MTSRNQNVFGVEASTLVGELPADIGRQLDWSRLAEIVELAVEGQTIEVQQKMVAGGPEVELAVTPFDGDGWIVVGFGGSPMVRCHFSQLLTWRGPVAGGDQ